jgi:hypothetical protein
MHSAIQLKLTLHQGEGHEGWHGTIVADDEQRVLRLSHDEAVEFMAAQLEQLLLQAVAQQAHPDYRESGRTGTTA